MLFASVNISAFKLTQWPQQQRVSQEWLSISDRFFLFFCLLCLLWSWILFLALILIPSHISHFFIPCFSLSCHLPAPSLVPPVDEHNAGTWITLVPSDLGPNHELSFTLPLFRVNTLTVMIPTFQLILSAVSDYSFYLLNLYLLYPLITVILRK